MSNVIFAPFIGEFGWELIRWQAYCRKKILEYDNVICFCQKGHEYLYQDFAKEIISVKVDGGIIDCWGRSGKYNIEYDFSIFNKNDVEIIKPCAKICNGNIKQKFIKFGNITKTNSSYDIIFHARADKRTIRYGDRNWPIEKWNNLSDLLKKYKIASIGTKNDAHCVKGTEDLRNLPMKELCDTLTMAKLCVGPSSGPMHLASLCGCRHIVWTLAGDKFASPNGRESSKNRYLNTWNPLNTSCEIITENNWQPPVELIYQYILRNI